MERYKIEYIANKLLNVLIFHSRIAEYLLECPSSEVRATFSKLLIAVAHYSKEDGVYVPMVPTASHSKSILKSQSLLLLMCNIYKYSPTLFSPHHQQTPVGVHIRSRIKPVEKRRFRIWTPFGAVLWIFCKLRKPG